MDKRLLRKSTKDANPVFLHPLAVIDDGVIIGTGTRVWQFVVILKGAEVGDNCNICANCFVENQAIIGSRVTIKSGVQIWNGIELKDDTFIGPNVTFANDVYPRSKKWLDRPIKTIVETGASIGANSTVLPGIIIGAHAMVGAGSVITNDVPAYAVVYGNPARIHGWICTCGEKLNIKKTEKIVCHCGVGYTWLNDKISATRSNDIKG
jgi:acetyltransferase-like isoleucine patch superfamily enzyme